MTKLLEEAISKVRELPEAEQDELAAIAEAFAGEVEERHTGVYVLQGEELDAVEEAMGQADRGEFVPDAVIAEADKRRGL